MLEVTGGNKDNVAKAQGQYPPTETVNAGWVIIREIGEPGCAWRREKSWIMTDTDPNSLWCGWKVGQCERGRVLVWSSRLEQEKFVQKKKKKKKGGSPW